MKLFHSAFSISLAILLVALPFPGPMNSGISFGNQDSVVSSAGMSQKSNSRKPSGAAWGASERERQLAEREAALNLKEQELNRLSARLDARMRDFETARKSMETTLSTRKKADAERYKKMLKLYKALRPEEAAGLIDKLDEDIAMELLNQMDTKTAAKLIPFLDRKRVLKWTRTSLKGN